MSPNLRRILPALVALAVVGGGVWWGGSKAAGDAGAGCAGSTEAPPDTSSLGDVGEGDGDAVAQLVALDASHFAGDTSPELQAALDAVNEQGAAAVPALAAKVRDQGCTEPSSAELVSILSASARDLPAPEQTTIGTLYADLLAHVGPYLEDASNPTPLDTCAANVSAGLELVATAADADADLHEAMYAHVNTCAPDNGRGCGELVRVLGLGAAMSPEWTERFSALALAAADGVERAPEVVEQSCNAAVARGVHFATQLASIQAVPGPMGACLVTNAAKFEDDTLVSRALENPSLQVAVAAAGVRRNTGTTVDIPGLLIRLRHTPESELDRGAPPIEAAVLAILEREPEGRDRALDELRRLAEGDEPAVVRLEALRARIEASGPPQ